MQLLARSNRPGIPPKPTEEVRAVATLLVELLTGTPSDATNAGVTAENLEGVPASLRWVLNRALSPVEDGSGYNLGQLMERLRQVASKQCLRDVLDRSGPLPLQEAVNHAVRLCHILEDEHEAGITHQNLVAENVILAEGRKGQRQASWVEFEIISAATPENLAEERRADVRAVGQLLYQMLTDKPAVEGSKTREAIQKNLSWLKFGLDRIVEKALATGEDGYADIKILHEQLHYHLNYLKPIQELDMLIRASYPLIYITSWEEERVLSALDRLAQLEKKPLYVWSVTNGLRDERGESVSRDTQQGYPEAVLDYILGNKAKEGIFVLLDLHPFLSQGREGGYPGVRRRLREVAFEVQRGSGKTLVLVSPVLEIPPECEKDMTVISFPLPTSGEIADTLDQVIALIQRSQGRVELSPLDYEELVRSATGLTRKEAELAFTMAMMKKYVEQGQPVLDRDAIEIVLHDKERTVHQSGALEIFASPEDFGAIGGLEALKSWFRKRAKAFTTEAQDFGLPAPKGVLLVGVSGCGKSLAAKALASEWRKPLLRLDPGALFSATVGSSEENLRSALQIAEAIAPSILWIDEIEKAFSGMRSVDDAGVTVRVFGGLITWLQEKTAPVFVIATANSVGDPQASRSGSYSQQSGLPPELLRKGRFDEIFFVDLPTFEERKAIFAVHIKKRGYDSADFDLDALAKVSENFSGAEIEQAVLDALYDAFDVSNRLYHLFQADFGQTDVEQRVKAAGFSEDQLEQAMETLFMERLREAFPDDAAEMPDTVAAEAETVAFLRNLLTEFAETMQTPKQLQKLARELEQSNLESSESPFGLTQQAILRSLNQTYSLYQMRETEIEGLRRWARDNTRSASGSAEAASQANDRSNKLKF